jgi:hypothetical protein
MSIKITGALPKGDANGLGALRLALLEHPRQMHAVIAIVDCKSTTTDTDTGERTPTARIRRIEAVLADDHPAAQRLMLRALENRTGRAVLPLDLEDDIRLAFGRIDPDTGERRDGDG